MKIPLDKHKIPLNSEANINTKSALNYFWIGFSLYTIFYSFPGIGISTKYFQAIQIIGILLFIPSAIYLIKWQFENLYLKIIFLIFIIWSLLTIIRGFVFDYEFIKNIFFNASFSVFLYFAPLILLFKDYFENLKRLFTVIVILNVSFVVFVIMNYQILFYGISDFHRLPTGITETLAHFLSIPTSFILMTYLYHSNKRLFFSLGILILSFLLVTIRARRGLMFMSICFMVFSYIIFYFTNRGKILKMLISISLMIFIVIYAYSTYTRNQSGMFGLITNRIDEDTRKGVEVCFFNSMSTLDLLFGKGINGKYYCPGIDETEGTLTIYRSVIETGYLQIVLKGGYFSLLLYLLITLPAIFKGLFISKNVLSKASAAWIILFTIFLYPTYVNMFSMNYLLIWFSVRICYSESLRKKTDKEIQEFFQGKSAQYYRIK